MACLDVNLPNDCVTADCAVPLAAGPREQPHADGAQRPVVSWASKVAGHSTVRCAGRSASPLQARSPAAAAPQPAQVSFARAAPTPALLIAGVEVSSTSNPGSLVFVQCCSVHVTPKQQRAMRCAKRWKCSRRRHEQFTFRRRRAKRWGQASRRTVRPCQQRARRCSTRTRSS